MRNQPGSEQNNSLPGTTYTPSQSSNSENSALSDSTLPLFSSYKPLRLPHFRIRLVGE